jgi:hypothetical protein
MPHTLFFKDPDEVLDYRWEWAARLVTNEVIQTSEFFIDLPGLTLLSDANNDDTATVWLSGGVLGEYYRVTNRVTTNMGRTYDWTKIIGVRQR